MIQRASLICNLNWGADKLTEETGADAQDRCVFPREPEMWRDGESLGLAVQALTHRRISNRVLLCSTGNSVQYPGLDQREKNVKRNVTGIADSLRCTAEINATL